jgi:hypothetical protein
MWGWGHEDWPDGCQKTGCFIFIIIIIVIAAIFISLISSMSG